MSEQQPPDINGVQLHLITEEEFEEMRPQARISRILDEVQDGKLVVLQTGLSSDEETRLIDATMRHIEPDVFSGIEIEIPKTAQNKSGGLMGRLLGNEKKNKLTLIGPANKLEEVDGNDFFMSLSTEAN
jgi:hypothetical protein